MRTDTTGHTEYCLGPLSQIPLGEGRTFQVGDQRVAVFRARSGVVYATQASCPHRGGPLADGLLGGTTVVCPLHAWQFDLITGAPVVGTCEISTYAVRLTETREIMLTVSVHQVPPADMSCDDAGARRETPGNLLHSKYKFAVK